MSEIYQTDIEFPTAIQEWGCFFLSILKSLALMFRPEIWNYGEIVRIYENSEIDHSLLSDLTVTDAQKLLNDVTPGKVKYWGVASCLHLPAPNEYEVLVYHRKEADFSHFVLGGGGAFEGKGGVGEVIYDPYSADGSLSVRQGICIGKRIFQVVEET